MSFFSLNTNLSACGAILGWFLTQPRGPQKATMDLGLGQHREATGISSSAPLSLFSHQNSRFLSSHLHTRMWNIEIQIWIKNKTKSPWIIQRSSTAHYNLLCTTLSTHKLLNWHLRCCCTKHRQHFLKRHGKFSAWNADFPIHCPHHKADPHNFKQGAEISAKLHRDSTWYCFNCLLNSF